MSLQNLIIVMFACNIIGFLCKKKDMKPRTLIELLSLSTNLYLITKDKEKMQHLNELGAKGKETFEQLVEEFSTAKQKEILTVIAEKAGQVSEELENKIKDMVEKAYETLQIAHVNQIKELQEEIATLKADVYTLQHKKLSAE
jgi:polyhydroxyalkanoate synthesis regulator phasin